MILKRPCMRPGADFRDTPEGYPLTAEQLRRFEFEEPTPVEGAVLTVPAGQENAFYVLLLGFEIVGEGRTVRGAPSFIYTTEESWRAKTFHINISLSICSPQSEADIPC